MLLYEFKADLEAYLSELGGTRPRTMKALIEWNQAHADAEMPLFGQELFIDAEKKGPLTTPAYRKALRRVHPAVAQGGHRRDDEQAQARCASWHPPRGRRGSSTG